MATEKESYFEFEAPKFVLPLDLMASQPHDSADSFFDADNSFRHECGMKTPKQLNSSETFMSPAEKVRRLRGNTRLKEAHDCSKMKDDTNKENEEVDERLGKPPSCEPKPNNESNIVLDWILEGGERLEKAKQERRLTRKPLRRLSLLSPNLHHPETTLSEALEDLQMKSLRKKSPEKFDGVEGEAEGKVHAMETRRDKILKTPTLNLRNREAIRAALKRNPSHNYMMHFHDTPPRFHTSNKRWKVGLKVGKVRIPKSPALVTKERATPSTPPNPQMREGKLLKDMKKMEVKLKGKKLESRWNVKLLEPQTKSTAIQQPFRLTKIAKKEVDGLKKGDPLELNGKPAPKAAHQAPSRRYKVNMLTLEEGKIKVKEGELVTGLFPVMRTNKRRSVQASSSNDHTIPLLRNKQEKINKVLEEEKKVREFKANPLPSYLNHNRNVNSTINSMNSTTSRMGSTLSSEGKRR